MIADLARRGTIKAASPKRAPVRESVIQASIIAYLAAVAPDAVVWAVPNASLRSRTGRATNAVPGLRKGVFDLSLILPDGRFACIEVKTDIGKLSPDQRIFKLELMKKGVPYVVATSVDDVREFLAAQGVKTREIA